MKRTAIFSMPFRPDSSLNAYGDYTHLVRYVTAEENTSYTEVWLLRPPPGIGVQPRRLEPDEVRQALVSIFRQNCTREFPPPVKKSWWRRFLEWLP